MSEHDHSHHHHHHDAPETALPPVDTGSRALEEALRSSFFIVKIVMVLLLGVFIFSGMKTVRPQERAIILRFGKQLGGTERLLGPGMHWAFPYPIDEVVIIPFSEIQTVTSTIGDSLTPAQKAAGILPPATPSLNPATEGYLVTADNNIIQAKATLGYRITDPLVYNLNFLNASNLVQNALNNALVYAASQSTVDEAKLNNTLFKERLFARLREQIEVMKLGITIEQSSEVAVDLPMYVKADFDAVTSAQQERDTIEKTARGNASSIVRAAEAESNEIIQKAQTESFRTVQRAQGAAKYFAVLLPEYQKNPELTRQRLLTDAWQGILARAADKFITLEPVAPGQNELRLLLSPETRKAKPGT
jgi:membrane protease subunit HflK